MLKHPVSLPLWKGIFLAGPFFFVLCHLSQGSLLRGWLLPCWEQVVTASGYWQGWSGGASVCPPCWMCSCYPSDREKKAFLGKKRRCRGDVELLVFQLLDCHSTGSDPLTASWKSPQNTKTVVTLAVMDNIIPQRALGFAGRKENVLKALEDLAGRTLVSKSSLNCVFSSLSRFWPWLSPVLSHWTSFIHRSCACTQLGGKGERITIFKCSFLR